MAKYLKLTVTITNYITEEVKRGLNSKNVYYNSIRNILSSRFPSHDLKAEITPNHNLPVVSHECETSLILR